VGRIVAGIVLGVVHHQGSHGYTAPMKLQVSE